MPNKNTFTNTEIDEAIEYLQGLGFNSSQAIPAEAQTLLACQIEDKNISIAVIIHADKTIKYDVSSGGGDEDYPIEIGEINSLEELHIKIAKLIDQ